MNKNSNDNKNNNNNNDDNEFRNFLCRAHVETTGMW